MLACYGIPCRFTELLKTHKSTRLLYGTVCGTPCLVGYRILVLWSRDIVPLAEMMTRSRAPSVYSDRVVGNSAEVGFFQTWIGILPGGSRFGFCFGRSCMSVQRLWRSSCVRVCQRVTFSYPLTHPHTG